MSQSKLESQPIVPIECAGTPFEIGRTQGEAVAEQIRGCHGVLRDLEAFQLLKPRWLPHWLFTRLAERRASRQWRESLSSAVPDMTERVRGIAQGADMRPGSVQLMNVLEPLMADVADLTDVPPLGGCSAVALTGAGSATGEPMLAHNFDYLPLIQPFYLMRDTRPAGGMRSLDFTCAPLAGAVDGMNEAGLCITCNYAYAIDAPTHAGTVSMAISDALANCKSVDEAATRIAARPRWGGGLLMLADPSGDVASLELSNERSALRRPGPREHIVFHTNRFQTPEMREVELPRSAAFTCDAPRPLRGRVVHDSAERRFERFAALASRAGTITSDEVTSFMADHGADGRPTNETICMHSDYWTTTATLQFFPRSRRVRVAFDSACSARFTDLQLDLTPDDDHGVHRTRAS